MKKLIFFTSLIVGAVSLQGMETDPEMQKQGGVNQIINEITEKISWLFGPKEIELEEFPEEILVNIILQMPGGNFTETIEAIKDLSQTNRIFNRLVNDPKTFEALLNAMGEKYNIDPLLITPLFYSEVAGKLYLKLISKSKKSFFLSLIESTDSSALDLEDYLGIIRALIKRGRLFTGVPTEALIRRLSEALYGKCPKNVEEQKECHKYIDEILKKIFKQYE
ncbi:MAG: hypothetical protein WDZ41_04635 [Candidatus Babeliales bacterium]